MRFDTLFRYRKQCMTAAIVLILLNHMKAAWPESPAKIAASFFYGGVDLFFFLSGVGCFFSWRRDRDPAAFLRRRALRILPSYLPLILVWIALQAAGDGIGPTAALTNLLGVHGFVKVEPSFNWYVSGMWLSYLLTPWLAALAERCDTKPRAFAALAGLLLLSAGEQAPGSADAHGDGAAAGADPGRRGAAVGVFQILAGPALELRPALVSLPADRAGSLPRDRRGGLRARARSGRPRAQPGGGLRRRLYL